MDGADRVVVARDDDGRGEVVLSRRGEVLELVVDGVFAMDSAHTATERALATLALDRLDPAGAPWRVLVGGLGLGYTARTLLDDPRVGRVEVVELHAALVRWAGAGLLPQLRGVDEARLALVVGDVLDVVPDGVAGTLDAVLLDVDNGPGFLVHAGNAALYDAAFLARVAERLRPGGVLAVWSSEATPDLAEVLGRVCGRTDEVLLPVHRDGRGFTYAVYLAHARGGVGERDGMGQDAGTVTRSDEGA